MVIIKVYDYDNKFGTNEGKMPRQLIVNASCVGGSEGIMAFFPHPDNKDLTCIAHGDDGNWWITDIYSNTWIEQIINALKVYKGDPVVKKRMKVESAWIKVTDEGISIDIYHGGQPIKQCGHIMYGRDSSKDLGLLLKHIYCKTMYIVIDDDQATDKVLLTTKKK
jgi:hypothetical protein